MKHVIQWIPKGLVIAYAIVGAFFAYRAPKKSAYHYLALAAGVAAIILVVQRDFWLPFLGSTVLPSSLIPVHTTTGDVTHQVKVDPGSKVIYWAAEQGITLASNPWQAYGDFTNAGVTLADEQGNASLSVATRREYKVPSGMTLPRHIHYRVIDASGAMMGPVQTVFV